jgi:hypothetical protein
MTTLKKQLRGISNLTSIDRRASEPLYRQIYESFPSRIIRGGLRPGELVLSTRSLARSLRISGLPSAPLRSLTSPPATTTLLWAWKLGRIS